MAAQLLMSPSFQSYEERGEFRSPVTAAGLPALPPDMRMAQLSTPLTAPEYRIAAGWLKQDPELCLRVYAEGAAEGYEFLTEFQKLRRFSLVAWDEDALALLPPHTTHLWLEYPRHKLPGGGPVPSCAALTKLRHLKELHLEGPVRDIESIATLPTLETLMLRSCRLTSLEPFAPLAKSVTRLEIRLGSLASLEGIAAFTKLRYLELWHIAGLADLLGLEHLTRLEEFVLQAQPKITTLPDLSRLTQLQRITLETMKGLTDLTTLRHTPALKELLLIAMTQLREEHCAVLQGHPTLRACTIGTGSAKRNAAIQALLGLPPVPPRESWPFETDEA